MYTKKSLALSFSHIALCYRHWAPQIKFNSPLLLSLGYTKQDAYIVKRHLHNRIHATSSFLCAVTAICEVMHTKRVITRKERLDLDILAIAL
jgi:hypothetical protein